MNTTAQNNHEPTGEGNTPVPGRRRTPGCLSQGCMVIAGIILVPYIINALFLLGGSFINHAKWQRRGSSSYTAVVSMTAFSPLDGTNTITVTDGKITAVKSSWSGANSDLQFFDELTIETMFSDTKRCALYFPLLWCSFNYDPYYGYPKKVTIDCPFPDACYADLSVDDLELIKP